MKFLRVDSIMRGLILAGMLLAISASAYAQRWEMLYGLQNCTEAGRNGVHRVSEGGYVAVGETFSVAAGCATSDAYVVRTNNHGALAWQHAYNIGRNDSATDIEEVKNAAGAFDGFIVTGVTNHGNAGDNCAVSRDIFLLRIDRCGNVVWVRTYGPATTDEIAWDVHVATNGNGVTTFTGDFLVAGSTTSATGRNGYLMRTNSAGTVIWGRLYIGPDDADDYFHALDQLSIGANAGQIVAAGGTTSYPTNTLDAWLVRVDGNNGAIINASAYGRTSTDEDFRSVQELVAGTRAGDIVAVGRTTTIGSPLSTDVYLLETTSALAFVVDRTLGDNSTRPDEGYYVREISLGAAVASRVIVTGYLTPPATVTHGLKDAFLQEFTTGTLAVFGGAFIYGADRDDWGWSVEPVAASGTCITAGFVVAGFSNNHDSLTTDPRQLYMFKTNSAKATGCNRSYTPVNTLPHFPRFQDLPVSTFLQATCTPPVARTQLTFSRVACALITDGTGTCNIPACLFPKANPGADLSDNVVEMSESAVSFYPNPVEPGSVLTLQCMLRQDANVAVIVSDMSGAIVYNHVCDCAAGINQLPVSTEGWASGSYVIQVKVGESVVTKRVVVMDK
jgi:hypothetical protein